MWSRDIEHPVRTIEMEELEEVDAVWLLAR